MADNDLKNLPETFYKQLLNSLDEGVYFVDRKRQIVFWNKGAENISGYSSDQVHKRFCGDGLLSHVDFNGKLLCEDGCPLQATIEDGNTRTADVYLMHRGGNRVPVRVTASPVHNNKGEIIGAVERFRDITPQLADRSRMNQLLQDAHTDPLTGIANRRYAEMILQDRFFRFRTFNEEFGIMFVDMDHLKLLNDEFGHVSGDCALKIIAKTLNATFRSEDIVSRWGGDEFLVILSQRRSGTPRKDKTKDQKNHWRN